MRAKLNGILSNDGGLSCEVCFEWGANNNYGNKTPWQSALLGAAFYAIITGLNSSQTYHFRAVAKNRLGIVYGADMTFTSLGEEGMIGLIEDSELLKIVENN